MKYNELLKIVKQHGWELYRHGANHDIYTHPEKEGILTIPRHGNEEIKKGLLQNLKKKIGF